MQYFETYRSLSAIYSDQFTLFFYQNSVADVSVGFRLPCWWPTGRAPAWCLHTNLYKFWVKVSPHIFHKKNCCDLNLGESLGIFTVFLFSDSGLYLLNGFYFDFDLFSSKFYGVRLKTSNWHFIRDIKCKFWEKRTSKTSGSQPIGFEPTTLGDLGPGFRSHLGRGCCPSICFSQDLHLISYLLFLRQNFI